MKFKYKDFSNKYVSQDFTRDTVENFIGWFFLEAVSEVGTFFLSDEMKKSDEMELKFVMNGIELPLEKTLERIYNNMKSIATELANDIVQEKFSSLDDILHNTVEDVRQIQKDLDKNIRDKLGLPPKEEW